jgi:hypothetical protein
VLLRFYFCLWAPDSNVFKTLEGKTYLLYEKNHINQLYSWGCIQGAQRCKDKKNPKAKGQLHRTFSCTANARTILPQDFLKRCNIHTVKSYPLHCTTHWFWMWFQSFVAIPIIILKHFINPKRNFVPIASHFPSYPHPFPQPWSTTNILLSLESWKFQISYDLWYFVSVFFHSA